MRIAVVHSFYSSSQPSGENVVVRDQVRALIDAGHHVELVARDTDTARGEPFYQLRSAVSVATGRGFDPGRRLHEIAPDVVHIHNTFPNWGTHALKRWSSRSIVTVHNFRPLCSAATLFRDGQACVECLRIPVIPAIRHACYRNSRLASLPVALGGRPAGPMRTLLQQAAAVTVLNEHAQDVYGRALKRSVDLVPNFVDLTVSDVEVVRSGWVYVGRFTQEKGVADLVRHWPRAERLDVVGTGPTLTEVQAAAVGHSNVKVIPHIDRDMLRRRLGSYEGLLVPSLWAEGLPTVLLEALAAGTPAIVSRSVAAGEQLARYSAAVIYDPRLGEHEISRALKAVRVGGDAMCARARQVHCDSYSRQAWLAAMTGVYERIAS